MRLFMIYLEQLLNFKDIKFEQLKLFQNLHILQ